MKDQIDLLQQYIQEGYINVQKHPIYELFIYNYSQKTQYDAFWNLITLNCRGLILDKDMNFVARPFSKFFNLSEHEQNDIPDLGFEVFEKMDGSMGVLYWADNKPFIATRGSFQSEQALKANEILYSKYEHTFSSLNPNYTYIFEIIYPENKIVVDYQDLEDLILLAIIDTQTGRELPLQNIGFQMVNRFDAIKDFDELKKLNWENKEGFVVKFKNDFRVKIKFEDYIRLHRILTQVSSKIIWENLKEGKDLSLILEDVPDEFFNWVKKQVSKLKLHYQQVENECLAVPKNFETRKQAAEFFFTQKYPSILFKMLDNQSYDEVIWRIIEPPFEKPNHRIDD